MNINEQLAAKAQANREADALLERPKPEGMHCPDCGDDPDDPTIHAEGCPRLGTCGQCEPLLPPPWHLDPPDWTIEYEVEHRRTMHS